MFKSTVLVSCTLLVATALLSSPATPARSARKVRVYANDLQVLADPQPLLADHPKFVQPVIASVRYEAPQLLSDASADLSVRAWRFSYNARGVIEMPNRLEAAKTVIVVVHPWGVDDGQGWKTPQPAGAIFACTPDKNRVMVQHGKVVVNPLLKRLRSRVGMVLYSLPGRGDPIRRKLYRSMSYNPSAAERAAARKQLTAKLKSFKYQGNAIPKRIELRSGKPVVDYFRQFPGLDASARYNNQGFRDLPIPVMSSLDVAPSDVVVYDGEGYDALRRFLQNNGIEHVLLCGYHADMCVCSTTAGHENLRRDFNVFLVGDAVQATFPANAAAQYATNQAVSFASLDVLVTQASWIIPDALQDPK
ncbi:MAG TPA: hypothetical protein DCE55_28425 [Planctomycetaceae bacterium]|nr:hypothetical protein [Planctomycetaceae bacterium]